MADLCRDCCCQAVRDSYITFRPIDSFATQVRLKNWEEMRLNQFLYMDGEVGKFIRLPQGPDSGVLLYSANGKRRCYFDTSAIVHAKDAPVYIVEPFLPGTKLTDNGLPIFPVYYANDDDGSRKLGADSWLTFTAPTAGRYLVRVTDIRGFSGPDFKYTLLIRKPKPDFKVSIAGKQAKIGVGSGQRLIYTVERIDGFDGAVRIDVAGLPPGVSVSTPTVIEPGHVEARGAINVDSEARAPGKELWDKLTVSATAVIGDQDVTKQVDNLGEIQFTEKPKIIVNLASDSRGRETPAIQELYLTPGSTITALFAC